MRFAGARHRSGHEVRCTQRMSARKTRIRARLERLPRSKPGARRGAKSCRRMRSDSGFSRWVLSTSSIFDFSCSECSVQWLFTNTFVEGIPSAGAEAQMLLALFRHDSAAHRLPATRGRYRANHSSRALTLILLSESSFLLHKIG